MANPEHVAKFKSGMLDWNKWRFDNPEIAPDLSDENFSHFTVDGYEILSAVLDRGKGYMGIPYLRPYLSGVDFSGCDFSFADLSGSYIEGSDFSDATLDYTNFTESIMGACDFHGANFCGTVFLEVDLSDSLNLEAAFFTDRGYVDFQTIERSWPLPEKFLKECGLPDNYIEYLPSLMKEPIQYYSCFISYADRNKNFADRLHADLQSADVRCYYAREDLKIGEKMRPTFDRQIRIHDKLLLILSEHSITSSWVEKEVETAFEKERRRKAEGDDSPVLFPIMIDGAVMDCDEPWAADIRRTRHIGDFRDWKNHDSYRGAFDRLMRDLKPAIMRLPGA